MSEEFYVGYQKVMPPGIAAVIRRWVIATLGLMIFLPAVLVTFQQPFANATFEFGVVKSFTGIVSEHPYPTLTLASPVVTGDGQTADSRCLLVAPGKHGAQRLFNGFDGQMVRVEGSLIYRDKKVMIEVRPESVAAVDHGAISMEQSLHLGMYTLRGEIVDSKCYLGVMKPGNLKPHKACAIRCISGGIPPVLCVRDANGNALYVMLAGEGHRAINAEVLPFVAESVEITGLMERRGGLLEMKIDPAMIKRL